MALLTRRPRCTSTLVILDPGLPDLVHAVGTAIGSAWHGTVAHSALVDRPDMTLQREALNIVVCLRAGIFGVGRPVARFAL